MTTRISIIGEDAPFYVSPLDSLGFVFGPTPHNLCHFPNGELRISFTGHESLYVYEDWGMLFVSDRPLSHSGPVLASRVVKMAAETARQAEFD